MNLSRVTEDTWDRHMKTFGDWRDVERKLKNGNWFQGNQDEMKRDTFVQRSTNCQDGVWSRDQYREVLGDQKFDPCLLLQDTEASLDFSLWFRGQSISKAGGLSTNTLCTSWRTGYTTNGVILLSTLDII